MNQTLNTALLTRQHYLFSKDGNIGVGYFLYRGQVIVVLFDGSYSNSFEEINNFSKVSMMSEDFARRDWNARVDEPRFPFVQRLMLSATEQRIRTVLLGLAIQFRDEREEMLRAETDSTELTQEYIHSAISDAIKSIKTQNKVYQCPYEHNTQYALEA